MRTTLMLAVYPLATLVLYGIGQWGVQRRSAASDAADSPVDSAVDVTVRTLLVSVNAAANYAVLVTLGLPALAASAPVLVVLGAAVPALAENRRYSTILAWTGPLLPTTWPATAVGVAAALLNYALGSAPGGTPVRFGFAPAACAVIVYGGPLYFFRCGYNLGNLVFIHAHFVDETGACSPGLLAHETGHTLNVAAFGFVFHYIGAVHENWGPPAGGAGHAAYAELWAESRRRAPGRPRVRGWAAASGVGPGVGKL